MERLRISCKKESLKTPTMDEEARTEEAAPSASLLELPTPTFGKSECILWSYSSTPQDSLCGDNMRLRHHWRILILKTYRFSPIALGLAELVKVAPVRKQ